MQATKPRFGCGRPPFSGAQKLLTSLKCAAHLIERALEPLAIVEIGIGLRLQLSNRVFLRSGLGVEFPDYRVSGRQLSAMILNLLLGEGLDLAAADAHPLQRVRRGANQFESSVKGRRLLVQLRDRFRLRLNFDGVQPRKIRTALALDVVLGGFVVRSGAFSHRQHTPPPKGYRERRFWRLLKFIFCGASRTA